MNAKMTIIVIGLLLICSTAIAGCTFTQQSTPSPPSRLFSTVSPLATATSTPTAGPKDVAAYFEGLLKTMNFAIKQPLTHSINSIGNDVYTGTVARGTTTATVTIETCDNIQDTQTRALDYRNAFINQGYVTRDDQSTYWSGATSTGEAWIIVDTTDLYVMAFYY